MTRTEHFWASSGSQDGCPRLHGLVVDQALGGSSRLLLQGLGCESSTIWTPLLSELEIRGDMRESIMFDVRGIGRSEGFPTTIDTIVNDALEIIRVCKPKSLQLVGHSLGGIVALKLATRLGALVDSVVLICSLPTYSKGAKAGFVWRAEVVREAANVSSIFAGVMPRSFSAATAASRPELIDGFKAMLAKQDPLVYAHLSELASEVDGGNELHALQTELHFVAGADDRSVLSEDVTELARQVHGKVTVISEAGHNIPIECPGELARLLMDVDMRLRAEHSAQMSRSVATGSRDPEFIK